MRFARRRTDPPAPPLAASPLSRPLDLVLHVGTGKAGSTTIQQFLRINRDALAEHGVLVPRTPGRARHERLGLYIQAGPELAAAPEWYQQKGWPGTPPDADPRRFRRAFRRRLFDEIERSGLSRAVFSDEVLFWRCSDGAVRRLRRFTDRIAKDVRIVVYLRRQDDHMVSRYQQLVKVGWVQRLDAWAREDMRRAYDYHTALRRQERLMGPRELVVRRFEARSFVDGSLTQDFLDAAGIDVRADALEPVRAYNNSLDADSVEFLRLLNLHRVTEEGAEPGLVDNRALVARLMPAASGPVLTLPDPTLDAFMEQWQEANRRVAIEYLDDPTGQLFRAPRKSRNTTTEQRLDPKRLDHFFGLLDLPEQLHAPLRRLAEREARTTGPA
jgi:hypothetical protein